MNRALPILLPVLAALIAYAADLPERLGAHPFWAGKIIWVGLPIGVLLAVALRFLGVPRVARTALAALLGVSAFVLSGTGKAGFAASYGESTLAGQVWFFGWIATCALAAAALSSLALPPARPH